MVTSSEIARGYTMYSSLSIFFGLQRFLVTRRFIGLEIQREFHGINRSPFKVHGRIVQRDLTELSTRTLLASVNTRIQAIVRTGVGHDRKAPH